MIIINIMPLSLKGVVNTHHFLMLCKRSQKNAGLSPASIFAVSRVSPSKVCFLDHVVFKHVLGGIAHDDVSRLQNVTSVSHL